MAQVRKYWAIFRTALINSLAYPGELIGRSLVMLPFMWIFFQLWTVTFGASGTESINGLTLRETLWYLMLAESIELSKPFLVRTIAENVRDGSIAYLLNKPYDFVWYQLSNALGESVFRLSINLLLGSAMMLWLAGPPPALIGFVVVIPALLGAWIINFCIATMLGLTAFVVEDVTAFAWIYQKIEFLLGGLLIPLDFYPAWLQGIARSLPFAAVVYGPARLFIEPSPALLLDTLARQWMWIAVLAALLALVYRRGLEHLAVNGG
jgi:ABC-2 type transport system permease protein